MIQVSKYLILALLICFSRVPPCTAQLKAVLLADHTGTPVYRVNENTPLIPASIFKILTSLAALETLGPGYRFHTMVAYDATSHRLYIKGFGDPLLISEELARLSTQIVHTYKPEKIDSIVMDDSFFSPDIDIPGTGSSKNPYDATIGALCANFNTFRFQWSDTTKKFISAEAQTPFLEIFKKDIQASQQKQGRILLSEDVRKLYPGLLIAHFLDQESISVSGEVIPGSFCTSCNHAMRFESGFTLDRAVQKLLTFSNNFIANQIMLALGAKVFGPPATLGKGVAALEKFAGETLSLKSVRLVEGSGISRQNRISARQMLTLLIAFKPYYRLLRQQGNDFFKTGTLSDVRTRAGYFMGQDKRLYPYVIMLNSTSKGYEQIHRDLRQRVLQISSARAAGS